MGGKSNITAGFRCRKCDDESVLHLGRNEHAHVWNDESSILLMLTNDSPCDWDHVSRITTFDVSTGKLLQDIDNTRIIYCTKPAPITSEAPTTEGTTTDVGGEPKNAHLQTANRELLPRVAQYQWSANTRG
eukprot:8276168-Karenia_brevis.AAC.1